MEHEYSVLGGVSRTIVGRYLSLIAAGISATAVFIALLVVDIAQTLGIPANIPPSILSLIGAGMCFTILYWALDRYAWRWKLINKFIKIPDLSGDWKCVGKTLDVTGEVTFKWNANITIVQTWDKIRVRLKTAQSGSSSNSAALIFDEADGYRLFYSYKNDPKIGEVNLTSHRGFAEITFTKDLLSGEGEYFNGNGRYTFGTMHLERN